MLSTRITAEALLLLQVKHGCGMAVACAWVEVLGWVG